MQNLAEIAVPRLLLAALSVSILSHSALSAADPALRIATWQGDRAGAFAFTLDDGQREHAEIAAPMFDAVGLKATFVINPGKIVTGADGWFASWDHWRALAGNGHEIGNHTMTHPNLTDASVTADMLEAQIVTAKQVIEREIGLPCITFCYPYNAESDAARALVARTHAVATNNQRKAYGGPDFTVAQANAWADEAIAQRTLIVPMIHGIDSGYMPFSSRAVLEDHLAYVAAKQDRLWVAPIGVIGRYQQERDAAKLARQASASGTTTFTLTCPLDPTVYHVPLTVVIASGPATSASASRSGGIEVPCTVRGEVICCDVVPGQEPVTVTWQ